MAKKTILDIDVKDKKVLVRVDFNVPLKGAEITDETRIKEALPTIQHLLDNGARVILMSHLGRPDGQVVEKYSLKPVAKRLAELLPSVKVEMANDVVGEDATAKVNALKSGEILLLENLRYEKGEEENEEEFCKKLASFGEIYVNDAFGTAHRKHASTYGVAKLLPNAVGFLIEKELRVILGAIQKPQRPFVAILGGAKVGDKLGIVSSLMKVADNIIIGGGMAYTFLKAQGFNIGKSLLDEEKLPVAKEILKEASQKGVNILLPVDIIVANSIDDSKGQATQGVFVPADKMGVDIGPKTVELFSYVIKNAKTVIWNGPMGVFENPAFANGTLAVAKAMASCKGTTIVGGGDSAAAVVSMGFADKMTHISTGGGASLKLFEGKELAGVTVIEEK